MRRALSTLLVLVFAALAGAAGLLCEASADGAQCCCGPVAADASGHTGLCCDNGCTKKGAGIPAEAPQALAAAQLVPALPADAVRVESSEATPAAATLEVALKSAGESVLRHKDPDVYVRKASFLI